MVGGWGVDRHWVRPFLINLSALVSASISTNPLHTLHTNTHALPNTYMHLLSMTHFHPHMRSPDYKLKGFQKVFFPDCTADAAPNCTVHQMWAQKYETPTIFYIQCFNMNFSFFFFFRLLNFCLVQEMCIFNKHKNRLRDMLVSEPTITWMCCKQCI